MRFQIYRDGRGEYRWRLLADDNRTIADCAEGYGNKHDCIRGMDLVKAHATWAAVDDQTETPEFWRHITDPRPPI